MTKPNNGNSVGKLKIYRTLLLDGLLELMIAKNIPGIMMR
jgi:hypothetical protein